MPDIANSAPSNGDHLTNLDEQEQIIIVTSKQLPIQNGDLEDHPDAPPLKRRKLTDAIDSQKSSPRPPSPPWKKVIAEGPTSFVEDGRRKSGRTNLVPMELQPQSSRRQTRRGLDRSENKPIKPAFKIPSKPPKALNEQQQKVLPADPPIRRGPGRPPKSSYINHAIKTEINSKPLRTGRVPKKHSPHRKSLRGVQPVINQQLPNGRHDSQESEATSFAEDVMRIPSPPLKLKKVLFRVKMPNPTIVTPANIPQPKVYTSFQEFLDKDPLEPYSGQDILSSEQITIEATIRNRVRAALAPGKLLDQQVTSNLPIKRNEVAKEYAHHDHLLAHVVHFQKLLRVESRGHRRRAEIIAHEAKKYVEDKRNKGRVKSTAEIEQERFLQCKTQYRSIVKDLEKLWLAVTAEVNATRQRQYEEEQQAKLKGHLNRVLDRTDQMLKRQEESISGSDLETSEVDSADDESSHTSDSEEISDSSSDSETEMAPIDPDAGMTIEELKAKYENIPAVELDQPQPNEVDESSVQDANSEEESDPETEMDSEFDTDDSEADEEDDDEDDGNDEDVNRGNLWSFFSRKAISDMGINASETIQVHESPEDEVDEQPDQVKESSSPAIPLIQELPDEMEVDVEEALGDQVMEVDEKALQANNISTTVDDVTSQEVSARTSPNTSATKGSEPESVSSFEPRADSQPPTTPDPNKAGGITPVPPLLRGTLREYQHEGLDWLANLYANGRSGILADEMGLGKTIQSIALLAHLATTYGVWGPHLIVVPTSVMLNWEMEFKKFLPGFKILTYYGSLEERKHKRRGWMADDSFNVCITSYQLVLQDANSFKRRRWHYMILDEAHNIKNFRSERWQTMMTFNTRARLLLTGTPLQNNLTELWSLLFFLHYGQENEGEDDAFAGLKEWSEWFKRPVESILEHGRQVLDAEDKEQVSKLHKVIRPFLLRRLKIDVEKQMPLKYEHVEMCRLSKRQRQLYDGFMSRAQTKETLASGNYLSIINALMQLRKVCNHPDLFETRPINTSFAMSKSVAATYEINDLLVRRKLFGKNPLDKVDLDFLQLVPISHENMSMLQLIQTSRRHAYQPMKALRDQQWQRTRQRSKIFAAVNRAEVIESLENSGRRARLQDIDRTMYYEAYRHHQHPIYGRGLINKLTIGTHYHQLSRLTGDKVLPRCWDAGSPIGSFDLVQSLEQRAVYLEPLVTKYACVTPAVVATDLALSLVTEAGADAMRQKQAEWSYDPFHLARMKLSIAFPDKRLLQYDCGKLQRLDKLLRQLQAGGHRALIFTQMTKVLDILEQFLNIHGHRYLRLDGSTKVEQRQILTDRFNNDTRILAFILSSRSGGIGINLTGADTVIFYDLDWNPAMDRQCTDRAHRIGQTRDVHIYRFVSEHTIESNILRKANQKQLLDDVVIQEGEFTTDYLNKPNYRDMLDENAEEDVAGAAMDRVLGNDKSAVAAFEHVEEKEDTAAAKVAAKEVQHADDGDFEDNAAMLTPHTDQGQTAGPSGAATVETDDGATHHIDDYLVRLQTFLLKDAPLALPRDKSKRGKKKGDEHRTRRAR